MMDDNYKSALLEYAQARSLGIPRYSVIHEEGPEHDRRFTVEVSIGAQSWGTGSGRSKKEAEQSAAAHALERIQQHEINSHPENEHAVHQQNEFLARHLGPREHEIIEMLEVIGVRSMR